MKVMKYLFLIVAILQQSLFSLQAQNSEGTEFWVTFSQHSNIPPTQIYFIEMQLRIVSGNYQTTTGTIYFTDLGTYHDFTINAYEPYDYSLDNTQKLAVYNTVSGEVTNYSVRITTSNPVTVYAFKRSTSQIEVTNVLPLSALGTEHYQMSYTCNVSLPDAFAVVATQNNTHLYHDDEFVATLDSGQVYYRTSNTDMTGAHIASNNPIAFFAVHQGTRIPIPTSAHSCYLMQQLTSVNTWGKTFFVPVTVFGKEVIRIVASQNNTDIVQKGGTIRAGVPNAQISLTGLQAGQFVELEVYLDSAGCYIQSDKPIGVSSYIIANSSVMSLPSQCWIPGIEQTVSKALVAPFVPSTTTNLQMHYALIVTPTATKKNTLVSIGDAPPTALSEDIGYIWNDNATAGMSFYSMPLSNLTTSYTFSNPNGIIILGYGTGTSSPAAYYYLAYSAMRDLDAVFYANDIHFQDLKDTLFCAGTVSFRAEIDGKGIDVDTVKWYINGEEEIAERNKLEWSKPFSTGNYEIRMWVHFENNDTRSKKSMLKIKNCDLEAMFYANEVHNENLSDTTFCNKTVHFLAETSVLSTEVGHIRWFIDYNDGNGYVEEPSALDQKQWSKNFANGSYPIKMWVRFANGEEATITGILKVQALWLKIRNVRY